ncbi:DNA glycosylase [Streptococcus orisratti]|uniref:DNA glycosylase n=1 Tax=Streptococcus orisratti TaxID=114652 RepID=UPI0029438E6C|nr:DNA glycosylase [Streptococcus orisratti]
MYKVVEDKVRRAFLIDKQIYLCEIAYSNSLKQLQIRILNQISWTSSSQEYISQFVSDWFDLARSLVEFYKLASSDSILNQLVNDFYGLRMVGMPEFYEAITWGILGQQINLAYTYTLKRRFTELLEKPFLLMEKTIGFIQIPKKWLKRPLISNENQK